MGRRGPTTKTAAADKLAGNPSRRKRQTAAPPIIAEPINETACPQWLPPPTAAEWHRALPLLKEPLQARDVAAFACYCQSVADLQWAAARLERDGRLVTTDSGNLAPHPAVKLASAAMARIKQFAAEFGLTPAARARVPDPPTPKVDELGDFLAKK